MRWLGTERLTWRDLLVIVRHAPRDSALVRALDPDLAEWGLAEQLQALSVDLLAWLQWAKTKDGDKGRNMPKPIPRPGVSMPEDVEHYGKGAVSVEEMADWLGWSAQVSDVMVEVDKRGRLLPARDAAGRFVKS